MFMAFKKYLLIGILYKNFITAIYTVSYHWKNQKIVYSNLQKRATLTWIFYYAK